LAALLLAALFLPSSAARAEAPMATEPEECVLFGNPQDRGVDFMAEENLFIMTTQSGLCAFDIQSGAQRWHRKQGANVAWGRKHVLGWTNNELFLLDKATGREVWWRREDRYGHVASAMLSPDGSRVVALFDPNNNDRNARPRLTTVVYETASRNQRVFSDMPNAFPVAVLPDFRTALFCRVMANQTSSMLSPDLPKEFFRVDLDSGSASEGHMLQATSYSPWGGLSASGLFAVCSQKIGGPTGLKVLDTATGALVRDLGQIPEEFARPTWTADEKGLYFTTYDQKKACVLDTQTGALQQTLSRPGHKMLKVRIQSPDEGPDMVISQDEDRNIWFWPPAPDATPTRLFDGQRIAPGSALGFQRGGYLTAHTEVSGKDALTAYQMEGMTKTGTWRLPKQNMQYGYGLFNRTMTHCVNRGFGGNGRSESNSFEVYADGVETALSSGKGDPLALSPDGRFLVVQTSGKRVVLQDLQEKRTVHVFDFVLDWDGQGQAVFSDDGRRVAVNAYPNLEVVDLTADFPRRKMAPDSGKEGFSCSQGTWNFGNGQSMCFSPDGTLLLCGGYGRAWLHNADSGALVHSFTETRQFYEAQPYAQGGFMRSLEQTARDWAGLATDRYKSPGPVHVAFAAFGDRILTQAGGQVVRVWDTHTGDLLRTIEAGLPEKRNQNGMISNRVVLSDNGDYALFYNRDNFAPASLWSLADGERIRRYQFPDKIPFTFAVPNDGACVYVMAGDTLHRWPGRPTNMTP
jgi:WD40 repeat protein